MIKAAIHCLAPIFHYPMTQSRMILSAAAVRIIRELRCQPYAAMAVGRSWESPEGTVAAAGSSAVSSTSRTSLTR